MAGIYLFIAPGNAERAEFGVRALRYYDDEVQETISGDRFTCIWSGVNDKALWGPAEDAATGNRVITSGRVSFDESEWCESEGLCQYRGGLSTKLLLHRFNKNGINGLLGHNGPAVVVVWDNVEKQLHLLTDHMGYHPVFLYRPDTADHCVVSTSPDVIASDPHVVTTLDGVAIAEFLSGWRATPPNTYYEQIKYAGVASHHVWDLVTNKHTMSQYWKPFEEEFFRDIDEASAALEEALKHSIRIRTSSRLGPVVSFTSGGQDSRAVLCNAAHDSELIALNLFDMPGRDAQVAQELCVATGTRYVGFGRDSDYYPRLMRDNARVGNGMWSLDDQHYLGTRDFIRALGARTVMTACTTDWVFKGYGLEKRYRRLFGRNLPLQKMTNERVDAFLPNQRLPVALRYQNAINERYRAWVGDLPRRLETDRDWLLTEERRIRPACYAVSVSGGMMYRAFPYDTFLGDRTVADCYSRMRPKWKLNSTVWGMTVRRMGGRAGTLADSGTGFVPGDSVQLQLLKFGSAWIKRKVFSSRNAYHRKDSIVTNSSWPDFGWCIRHSEQIAGVWHGAPVEDRELLNGVFGKDLWAADLNYWSGQPSDYFRMLTMLNWLGLAR